MVATDGDNLPVIRAVGAVEPSLDPVRMLLADKRSAATQRAYAADLRAFFGEDHTAADVRAFLSQSVPQIALRLTTWKAEMLTAGLSEATINRRLAAVRSLLKFAARIGISSTDGRGLVDGEKSRAYRDTRGISLAQMRRLVKAPRTDTTEGLRDAALLRLLCENALRRAEVCRLDVTDFDREGGRLAILGKGRGSQKEWVTLSPAAVEAISRYISRADVSDGALFRNRWNRRLTTDGLYFLVGRYGKQIGVPHLAPHRLRHASITAALDATKGDVRKVQKLSRHAAIQTLMIYDDQREDAQGKVSNQLSSLLG